MLPVFARECMSQNNRFEEALDEEWTSTIRPLLRKYCGDCHGDSKGEADVNILRFDTVASVRKQPALWDQIKGVARIGAMPPPEEPQPTMQEKERLSNWVEMALHRADCSVAQPPGHVTIRRLNNLEYDNTIRQIFSIPITPSQKIGFVSDEVGNGFDNQGEVLSIPTLLLEKYFQAAELVANTVIVTDRESLRKQSAEGESLFEGESVRADFWLAEGDYEISLRMKFGDNLKEVAEVALFIDDQLMTSFEVDSKSRSFAHEVTLSEGTHSISARFVDDPMELEAPKLERRVQVERIRVEGPAQGMPSYPPSHRLAIPVVPSETLTVRQAAIESFKKSLRLLYRRPPEPIEVERIVSVVEKANRIGMSFEESMKFGLQAALVSPEFLFRLERQDGPAVRPGVRALNAHDLASRISYFLWSGPPDETLLDSADKGELLETKGRQATVERMLDDPRSTSLVQGFFSQWLGLRNLATIEVDAKLYPAWSDRLRASMAKETELFCKHLIGREGRLSDVLRADFTFVNPRLAELYGLPYQGKDPKTLYVGNPGRPVRIQEPNRSGLYFGEDEYLRVPLPASRRGMLTQASILTLTSNPSRTSPVKRGKWVLENIVGDPPPLLHPMSPPLKKRRRSIKT